MWSHIEPILMELKSVQPNITVIHFYSDGPTTQYRNKLNFYIFTVFTVKLELKYCTRNLFESGHGKGAPDAVGGSVKRRADGLVIMVVTYSIRNNCMINCRMLNQRFNCTISKTMPSKKSSFCSPYLLKQYQELCKFIKCGFCHHIA